MQGQSSKGEFYVRCNDGLTVCNERFLLQP
jgi:hypothetical protein